MQCLKLRSIMMSGTTVEQLLAHGLYMKIQ